MMTAAVISPRTGRHDAGLYQRYSYRAHEASMPTIDESSDASRRTQMASLGSRLRAGTPFKRHAVLRDILG